MIHLVTSRNRRLYADALTEMHRLRKAVFVDELKWPLIVREDGGEYDEYDDERAMYLLGFDSDGHVEISMRVRPTDDGRCMIANHFPQLVAPDEPPLCAPGVWEGSRIMSVPRLRAAAHARRRNHELQLATIEAAQDHGVTRVLGMIEIFWLAKLQQALWKTRTLGLPTPHEGGDVVAFEIDTTPEAVREGRERLQMATALHRPEAAGEPERPSASA